MFNEISWQYNCCTEVIHNQSADLNRSRLVEWPSSSPWLENAMPTARFIFKTTHIVEHGGKLWLGTAKLNKRLTAIPSAPKTIQNEEIIIFVLIF